MPYLEIKNKKYLSILLVGIMICGLLFFFYKASIFSFTLDNWRSIFKKEPRELTPEETIRAILENIEKNEDKSLSLEAKEKKIEKILTTVEKNADKKTSLEDKEKMINDILANIKSKKKN